MKSKLIKDHDDYHLVNDKQFVIGTTDESILSCTDKYKLSLKNCQAIERGYDLDELAKEKYPYEKTEMFSCFELDCKQEGFIEGAKTILEILGDKKFSEKDVKLAINLAWDDDNLSTTDIIQSLQQTEWDVEVEMEKVIDETKIVGAVKGVKGSGNKITTYKSLLPLTLANVLPLYVTSVSISILVPIGYFICISSS